MQRREGRPTVIGLRLPETGATQAHVPVGHVLVDKLHDGARGQRRLVRLEQPVCVCLHRGEARQHPAIERGPRGHDGIPITGRPSEIRILRKNPAVGVPQRHQETAGRLSQHVFVEPARNPDLTGADQEQSHGIDAVSGDHAPRVDRIPLALRHLLARGVEHQIVHQHMAIRRGGTGGIVRQRIAECRGNRQQRVKPATRLIDSFCDVIGGEMSLEHIGILKRIVPLRKRHAAGIEPGIDHFRHASHRAGAAGGRPGVVVDKRLVWIKIVGQRPANACRELRKPPDHFDLGRVRVVDPHRQRRAPVSIARNRPVDIVLEPLSKTTGANLRRLPLNLRIPCDHVVLDRRRLHEPRSARVVEERRAAAPAMRI